jgi:cytochrome P450
VRLRHRDRRGLPLLVIAELLGVAVEDRWKLFHWSNRLIGAEDPTTATWSTRSSR